MSTPLDSPPAVSGDGPVSQATAVPDGFASLPSAAVAQGRWWPSWYWLLPLLTVLIVAVVLVLAWSRSGVTITLRFTQGHGLKPGDAVRCRGIIVGEVRKVWLDSDTGDVLVRAELHREAADLARADSKFWIARPQADLATGISGLDTVIGAKYIHVVPGEGDPQYDFVGLAAPPVPETIDEKNGLKLVLQAHRRAGLRPGTPVTFRQVRVGSVLDVGLASDASAVDVHVYIRPAYARLVRSGEPKTRFWNTSGVRFEWQKLRPSISLESAESVLVGGVALATPKPQPGKRLGKAAVSGDRFDLEAREPEGVGDWKPVIPLSDTHAHAATVRPVPATLEYQIPHWLTGMRAPSYRRGLVIPSGQDLLGPSDLLTVPAKGKGELNLVTQPPLGCKVPPGEAGPLSIRWLASALPRSIAEKKPQLRAPSGPEECLLVGGPDQQTQPVSVARLKVVGGLWEGIEEVLRDSSPREWRRKWHGAAVVARKDGALVGLLMVPEGRRPKPYVVPLDEKTKGGPAPSP